MFGIASFLTVVLVTTVVSADSYYKPQSGFVETLEFFNISTVDEVTLSKNWRLECDNKFLLNEIKTSPEEVMKFIRLVNLHGINRIAQINPELSNVILRKLRSRKMIISCGTGGMSVPGAMTRTYPEFSEIYLRLPIYRAAVGLIKYARENYQLMTIFHEFLHAIKMDNLSSKDHNADNTNPLKDVVMSCSAYAFDNYFRNVAPFKTCYACALTVYEHDRTEIVTNNDRLSQGAQVACASPALYYFGDQYLKQGVLQNIQSVKYRITE